MKMTNQTRIAIIGVREIVFLAPKMRIEVQFGPWVLRKSAGPDEMRMQKCELRSSGHSTFRIRYSTFSLFVLEQLLLQLGGDAFIFWSAPPQRQRR
jgi:DNA recombination-dependent growth factor C